jgi:hypothetical protein
MVLSSTSRVEKSLSAGRVICRMDLSSDLILEILKYIDNTSHLASACLVNRIFHRYASPLLYRHIAIYSWMKDAKKRVVTLFSTLSRRPNLAFFVRSLGELMHQDFCVFLLCTSQKYATVPSLSPSRSFLKFSTACSIVSTSTVVPGLEMERSHTRSWKYSPLDQIFVT